MNNLIKEYNPDWPKQFEQIRSILREALNHPAVRIEHIGSTAVPGLAAKPIIDIDVVYTSEISFDWIDEQLQKLDYYCNGDQGIPGRYVFKRLAASSHPILDRISHHLYACHEGSKEWQRHRDLRDHLQDDPRARKEYAALKYCIAAQAGQDRKQYALLKQKQARSFIEKIIDTAKSK